MFRVDLDLLRQLEIHSHALSGLYEVNKLSHLCQNATYTCKRIEIIHEYN